MFRIKLKGCSLLFLINLWAAKRGRKCRHRFSLCFTAERLAAKRFGWA
jgi:hypothetical protein